MKPQTDNKVAALRTALRGAGGRRAVDQAAAPLLERFFDSHLRFCDRLARGAPRLGLEGDDLAVHAWGKMMRYLAGPGGDQVQDEAHFGRLLMRAAKGHLLDCLRRQGGHDEDSLDQPIGDNEAGRTRGDTIADTGVTAEDLLLPKDSAYFRLVEELFADEERFRRTYRQRNQRHPRNYKALVLYQIGAHWREEVGQGSSGDFSQASLIRHYVELLGVPGEQWRHVESAAERADVLVDNVYYPEIMAAVNTLCGTKVRDRKTLTVLRYEMNRFVAEAR